MMDSQDNILEQEVKEEVNQEVTAPEVETPEVAPVAEEEAPAAEEVALVSEEEAPAAEEEQPRKVYETKKEVLDRIKEIAHGDEAPQKDEIDYLMATSTLLQNGVLQLAGEKQNELAATMGVEMENNANFMSDEDIKKKLSGNANQLKKWLSSDDIQPYVLDKIATIAKGMNLSANKLQVLREKMPDYDFLG